MTHQLPVFAALIVYLLVVFFTPPFPTEASIQDKTLRAISSDLDLEALEERVHELVNLEREEKKIAPLSWQPRLVELARSHSADMALRNFVDHINPEGQDPTDRAIAAKFECKVKSFKGVFPTGIGENIFMSYLYENIEIVTTNGVEKRTYNWKSFEDMAQEIVKNWMNSQGHKENILRQDYHYEGIGIATNLNSQLFVTQNFC